MSHTASATAPHLEVDLKDASAISHTTYRSGVPATIFAPTTGFLTVMVSMVTGAPSLIIEAHARTAYEPGTGAGEATSEEEAAACSSSAASCPSQAASQRCTSVFSSPAVRLRRHVLRLHVGVTSGWKWLRWRS